MNLKFPQDFFIGFVETIKMNKKDYSEDAILSYNKLKAIINVYMSLPSLLKGDSNNSNAFKFSLEYQKEMNNLFMNKTDRLIKYVHIRIEEKFKDFRHAFRSFDKNFDGNLSFKEFMCGLENIGIILSLEDFQKIFKALDYDNAEDIDFEKFCLLNTDKIKDKNKMGKYKIKLITNLGLQMDKGKKKPPLPGGFYSRENNN